MIRSEGESDITVENISNYLKSITFQFTSMIPVVGKYQDSFKQIADHAETYSNKVLEQVQLLRACITELRKEVTTREERIKRLESQHNKYKRSDFYEYCFQNFELVHNLDCNVREIDQNNIISSSGEQHFLWVPNSPNSDSHEILSAPGQTIKVGIFRRKREWGVPTTDMKKFVMQHCAKYRDSSINQFFDNTYMPYKPCCLSFTDDSHPDQVYLRWEDKFQPFNIEDSLAKEFISFQMFADFSTSSAGNNLLFYKDSYIADPKNDVLIFKPIDANHNQTLFDTYKKQKDTYKMIEEIPFPDPRIYVNLDVKEQGITQIVLASLHRKGGGLFEMWKSKKTTVKTKVVESFVEFLNQYVEDKKAIGYAVLDDDKKVQINFEINRRNMNQEKRIIQWVVVDKEETRLYPYASEKDIIFNNKSNTKQLATRGITERPSGRGGTNQRRLLGRRRPFAMRALRESPGLRVVSETSRTPMRTNVTAEGSVEGSEHPATSKAYR